MGRLLKIFLKIFASQEPGIEWRKIAGLRDFAAHAYFNVSSEIVWDVVQNKLFSLLDAVVRISGDRDSEALP